MTVGPPAVDPGDPARPGPGDPADGGNSQSPSPSLAGSDLHTQFAGWRVGQAADDRVDRLSRVTHPTGIGLRMRSGAYDGGRPVAPWVLVVIACRIFGADGFRRRPGSPAGRSIAHGNHSVGSRTSASQVRSALFRKVSAGESSD